MYWRLGLQWAVRHGDWKLVASRIDGNTPRLINLAADISETNDLIAKNTDKATELKAIYDKWNAEQAQPLWGPGSKDDPTGTEPAKNAKKRAEKTKKKAAA